MSGLSGLSHVDLSSIPGAPSPRAAHTCEVVENFLVVFGGWSGREALGDAYAFHVKKRRWYLLNLKLEESTARRPNKALTLARNNHACAVLGDEMFVHGGHDGTQWLGELLALDVSAMEARVGGLRFGQSVELHVRVVETSGKVPTKRACHTLTAVGQLLYAFGGYDGTQCFNDLDVFDPGLGVWSRLSKPHGKKPAPRNAHSMVTDGRSLFLMGGHSGSVHFGDLYTYTVSTHTWTCVEFGGSVPPGLRGHACAFHKGELFLFGGYNGDSPFNTMYVYNVRSSTWTVQDVEYDYPLEKRQRCTMVPVEESLYLFGGFNGTNWLNDLHSVKYTTANSPYFYDLLVNNGGEDDDTGTTNDTNVGHFKTHEDEKKTVVELNEWSLDVVMKLMEYFYTAKVEDLSNCNHYRVCELMGLADSCSVNTLKNLCQEVLVNKLDIDNSCYLLKYSKLYNAEYLKQCCFDFISEHAADVMVTPGFDDLSTVPSLVLELAKLSITKMS